MQGFRLFHRSLIDAAEYFDCVVENLARFCFGRLYHQRFMNDKREVHCWWMDSVVQQSFCNIHRRNILFLLELFQCHDKFVHASGVECHVIKILEVIHHVVAV